jgi:competence protein ComEC
MSNDTNPNNYSVVIRLDYGENSFLFTGDAETKYDDDKDHENDEDCSEEEMLKYHPSSKFKCDVFKVGHHGAKTSTTEAFLTAVSPQYAVISCGRGNVYAYPHIELMTRLLSSKARIYRTDTDGTIVFRGDGATFSVLEK